MEYYTILYISLYIACPCSQEISRHPNTSKRKIETCHLDLGPEKTPTTDVRMIPFLPRLLHLLWDSGVRNFLTTPIEDRSGNKWMVFGSWEKLISREWRSNKLKETKTWCKLVEIEHFIINNFYFFLSCVAKKEKRKKCVRE